MNSLKKAYKISILDSLKIEVVFEDKEKKILDISPYCSGRIFKPFLTDRELFATAKLDELGGIEWANGASLSPETVYLKSK